MPESDRKCRSHNDESAIGSSQMFSRYTYDSCQVECKLKEVHQSGECQPWDTPHLQPLGVCQKAKDDLARAELRRDPDCKLLPKTT